MQKRIQELDVLRVLAMLFVVTYHFALQYVAEGIPCFNLFCTTVNYDFGNIAVTLFIALSGGLLYKKYGTIGFSEKGAFKEFYIKRFKTIYPPFWILSLYIPLTMIRHFMADGNVFFMGHPLKLLFTIVGFDGYVRQYGVDTYVFCGDWFVGAIVLLYLLFPLLAKCYRHRPYLTLSTLAVLYSCQYLIPAEYDDVFGALPVTLSLKFCVGFMLVENLDRLKDLRLVLVSAVVFVVLTFVDIPGRINTDCLGTIAALALFVVVLYIAPFLLRFRTLRLPVQKLAKLSYCVFLVQHVGIVWAQMAFIKIFERMHWNFTEWNVMVLLCLTFAVIFLASWILKRISDTIVKFFTFSNDFNKKSLMTIDQ
ncbi:acyltransferase [Fibrobacter sp. UWB13]|uniref:acyltransferase family protein n=1 Tax=Fibrobacter sp. UWB13 TaxID=1896204 RepID=UPI000A0DE229|nr:acyltransferase family protein [Fibrobacter sp. UWB13]SMG42489.1 Peptidoglycan/LPS O-acetylase OafA/YrhL, contains acyltransferase and SGNH-hydrolase domains [Fibrobacter sp. UWB13]